MVLLDCDQFTRQLPMSVGAAFRATFFLPDFVCSLANAFLVVIHFKSPQAFKRKNR
jgi:hypothetical protein